MNAKELNAKEKANTKANAREEEEKKGKAKAITERLNYTLTPSSTTASRRSRAAVCWIGLDSRYGPSHQESNTGPVATAFDDIGN